MKLRQCRLITIPLLLLILLSGCRGATEPPKDYYDLDADIEAIGNILGKQEIVILGESTHWSTEIAKQKIELIDYLAEEHGFNKLFLETGDSEFNYYQESELPVMEGVVHQYQHEVFRKYLDGSAGDIQVLAMDWLPIFTDNRSSSISSLERNIVDEISGHDTNLGEDFKRSEFALRNWVSKGVHQGRNIGDFEPSTNVYENIISQPFFNELTSKTQDYITSRQENFEKYYTQFNFKEGDAEYNDYREIGMADKVLKQMDHNDKAIIWVSNLHSNYDVTSIDYTNEEYVENRMNNRVESLGALLRDSEYHVYNLGLFHNEAESYALWPEDYDTPRKEKGETLEGCLGNRVQKDIFIDFASSDFIEENQYKAHWFGYFDYKMVPQEQFDGLIYIDHINQ